ncbi:hypothetical protein [Actinoplanes sp. HUAS TT8]|uniref:hypothetical protein n=1 Tax=Actinoplanes sp. HUAS TT8 TaxID=3447453 RepID=UPI003F527439
MAFQAVSLPQGGWSLQGVFCRRRRVRASMSINQPGPPGDASLTQEGVDLVAGGRAGEEQEVLADFEE